MLCRNRIVTLYLDRHTGTKVVLVRVVLLSYERDLLVLVIA